MAKKQRTKAEAPPVAASPGWGKLLVVILLIASVWSVYGQVGSFEFTTFDDGEYVTQNPGVMGGLSIAGLRWALTAIVSANWHPLTLVAHQLDVTLFGLDAGAHHVVNVLWHSINSVFFFFLFCRLTKCTWRSAFVAALFAVHPLHVESVAWVSERKDVLSAFIFALTLFLYARFVDKPSRGRYCATLAAFALGLLAKPMLVTLPCVLLLVDVWPLERWRPGKDPETLRALRGLVAEKMPFFALTALSCGATFFAQRNAIATTARVSLGLRIPMALQGYTTYLGKLFWPTRLAALYPIPESIPLWSTLASAALLAAFTVAALRLGRSRPWLWVGWFWYLGMLVPVIGLVQVGYQAYADRYTYLPYLGLFWILAWGGVELAEKWKVPRRAQGAVAAVALCALGIAAWKQTGYWKDSVALFARCIEVTPPNYVAESNYGAALTVVGRTPEAGQHFAEALRINPNFFPAHLNLAVWCQEKGEYGRAVYHCLQALRIDPSSRETRVLLQICRQKEAQARAAAIAARTQFPKGTP